MYPLPAPDRGDQSGIAILLANAVTIALALWQNWDLSPILAVYWCQSVTIGAFHFCRMHMLKNFTTEGLSSNDQPVPETPQGKRSTANFFLLHYGFFHLVYFVFISTSFPWDDRATLLWVAAGALGFLLSHALSFRRNVAEDLKRRPNLGAMLFLPYLRIVPMHLTIIVGGALSGSRIVLTLFLVLKSFADYLMHRLEHAIMRKGPSPTET